MWGDWAQSQGRGTLLSRISLPETEHQPALTPRLSFDYRYMEKQQGLESASLACDNKPIALVSRKTTPDAGLIPGSLLM